MNPDYDKEYYEYAERTMRDLSELIKTMNEEKQEQELPLRKKKTIPINEFMAGTA